MIDTRTHDPWLQMGDETRKQLAKLEAIKNRRTRYEIILTNGTETYRIGYGGRSLSEVRRLLRANIEDVHRITKSQLPFITKGGDKFTTEWRALLSGRTQREAILAGELVWVGSKALKS